MIRGTGARLRFVCKTCCIIRMRKQKLNQYLLGQDCRSDRHLLRRSLRSNSVESLLSSAATLQGHGHHPRIFLIMTLDQPLDRPSQHPHRKWMSISHEPTPATFLFWCGRGRRKRKGKEKNTPQQQKKSPLHPSLYTDGGGVGCHKALERLVRVCLRQGIRRVVFAVHPSDLVNLPVLI